MCIIIHNFHSAFLLDTFIDLHHYYNNFCILWYHYNMLPHIFSVHAFLCMHSMKVSQSSFLAGWWKWLCWLNVMSCNGSKSSLCCMSCTIHVSLASCLFVWCCAKILLSLKCGGICNNSWLRPAVAIGDSSESVEVFTCSHWYFLSFIDCSWRCCYLLASEGLSWVSFMNVSFVLNFLYHKNILT